MADYVLQKTTEKNALISSGIASSDARIGERLSKGGKGIDLPFWKRTNARAEVLSDEIPMTTNKIVTSGDYAAVHARGIGYASNDLAMLFSGDDPMAAIGDMVTEDWDSSMQDILLASLEGVFNSDGMKDHVNDISSLEGNEGIINNDALIDTIYKMGDNFDALTGIAMHSAVMGKLSKLKLLDDYTGNVKPEFATYMGRRIIVDDSIAPLTVSGGKKAYPIYLFGKDAVAYNESKKLIEIEPDRDSAQGDDYLYTRRVFTMHPRGIKWIGKPAGVTPSDAELKLGENWELVEASKNVAITKLIARLD